MASPILLSVPEDDRLLNVYTLLRGHSYLKLFFNSFIPPNQVSFVIFENLNLVVRDSISELYNDKSDVFKVLPELTAAEIKFLMKFAK